MLRGRVCGNRLHDHQPFGTSGCARRTRTHWIRSRLALRAVTTRLHDDVSVIAPFTQPAADCEGAANVDGCQRAGSWPSIGGATRSECRRVGGFATRRPLTRQFAAMTGICRTDSLRKPSRRTGSRAYYAHATPSDNHRHGQGRPTAGAKWGSAATVLWRAQPRSRLARGRHGAPLYERPAAPPPPPIAPPTASTHRQARRQLG